MVMARRKQARLEAAELGYETVDFNNPAKACLETLFLINTVPDRVIDESLIMLLQKDAIIIDIASKPGGCDFEACKRYQINCTHALGLPGIYCPKTGAKILYDCMKRKGMTELMVISDCTVGWELQAPSVVLKRRRMLQSGLWRASPM